MTYPPPGGQDPYQPQQPEPTNPYQTPPPDQSNPYAQPLPPQPYGDYATPPAPTGNNGLSLASMITGIVSVVLACCCWFLGLPAGIAAIVLGFIGLKQTRERGQAGRGMAIAGIATGAAGVLLAIIVLILSVSGAMEGWIGDLTVGTTGSFGSGDD